MSGKIKLTTKTRNREKVAVYLENDQIALMREIQEDEGVPIARQIRDAVKKALEGRKK